MPYTSLTGRGTLCNATIFKIGTTDQIALMTDATLNIDQEVVELTAPRDVWKQKEPCGPLDWNIAGSKIVGGSAQFLALIVTGGTVAVSADILGADKGTFYCYGLITGASHKWANPQTEDVTIVGYGMAPSIT